MATATHLLTLEEFRARYAHEKPHYEYWFGEAVQKSAPTWLHGVLQALLGEMLRGAGYKSGTEVELRVVEDWQPKPDVIGITHIDERYPTKPPDVVIEVLSPDDKMQDVFRKCRQYARIGAPAIFVLDPESQDAWIWNRHTDNLERIDSLDLPNGQTIPIRLVWEEMDRRK
jgi:Uma2 family endonuclease